MHYQVTTQYREWVKKGYKNFPVVIIMEAISFAEVEKKVAEKIESAELNNATEIKLISPFRASEFIFNESDESADKWFKAKVTYEEEGRRGKTKKVANYIMVFASDSHKALSLVEKEIGKWTINTTVEAIQETKIRDIYPHIKKEK